MKTRQKENKRRVETAPRGWSERKEITGQANRKKQAVHERINKQETTVIETEEKARGKKRPRGRLQKIIYRSRENKHRAS